MTILKTFESTTPKAVEEAANDYAAENKLIIASASLAVAVGQASIFFYLAVTFTVKEER